MAPIHHVDEIDDELQHGKLDVAFPEADGAYEMRQAVIRSAFPNVYTAISVFDDPPSTRTLREAVLADLAR